MKIIKPGPKKAPESNYIKYGKPQQGSPERRALSDMWNKLPVKEREKYGFNFERFEANNNK